MVAQSILKSQKLANCKSCHGSGAKDGAKPKNCPSCHGQGQVRMQQGFFTVQQTCPNCRGQGQVISDPCTSCHGQGRVQKREKLSVKIPIGIDDSDRIRLSGKGEAGSQGGSDGDLYVRVHLKKHPIFTRVGKNLTCDVPISFIDATLGGEIEIPTLDGRVKLKIPPETQSGKQFRLRGKGVKALKSHGIGDLLCKVIVETPIKLTKEQKTLLEQLNESLLKDPNRHRPKSKSWFDNVKSFFEKHI